MSSGSRPAPLRIAAMGAGFWARFQLSAWREVPGVEIAALCDVERAKAEKMAHNLGIPRVFSDPLEMLQQVRPQLVDVITSPSTHADMVRLAASQRVPVVVQKPMAL